MKDIQRYRISLISYHNTIPFQYGLKTHPRIAKNIIISEDIPSLCADKLLNKQIDIGLVPVATLKHLSNYYILSDYCIGAVNKVKSVVLLSHVPINQIDEVVLDYQSRTSVKLVQVLSRKLWNINPVWIQATPGYEHEIKGKKAAVIIGDRTFDAHLQSIEYRYDLSEEWYKLTKLPFVFAVWITLNKSIAEDVGFVDIFNQALNMGFNYLDAAVDAVLSNRTLQIERHELVNYLVKNISYEFDEEKRKAMKLFLKYLDAIE